jgi:hypothetical protein
MYTLDLFCDQLHDPRVEESFTGQTFSGCCAKARKAGWRINYDSKTATCPSCTRSMRVKVRKLAQDRRGHALVVQLGQARPVHSWRWFQGRFISPTKRFRVYPAPGAPGKSILPDGRARAEGEGQMIARFGMTIAFVCGIAALTILAALLTNKLQDPQAWMAVVFFVTAGCCAWAVGRAAR